MARTVEEWRHPQTDETIQQRAMRKGEFGEETAYQK